MEIKIQHTSKVNAHGTHINGNCKPVFCITTGEVYASAIDASIANGMCITSVSGLIAKGGTSRSGKKFCYVSQIVEYLEEIAEASRARTEKVRAYDEIQAQKQAERIAKEAVAKHQAKCEALRVKLEAEMKLLNEAERIAMIYT